MATSVYAACRYLCRPSGGLLQVRAARSFYLSAALKSEWDYKEGKFNSVHVRLKNSVTLANNFEDRFRDFIHQLQSEFSGLRAILCFIPMCHCHVCQDMINLGFSVHHAKNEYIAMTKWMVDNEESKIPPFSTHQVGVSGYVLDEINMKTLVVQDKGKTARWKFPGGFSEPGENISDTCVREVKEETGIVSEFRSILAFRQQHQMRFGQSDLYFICRLHPLTFTINKCEDEIAKCEWLPVEELLDDKVATPLTQLITRLILKGVRQGFDTVDLVSSNMKAWVPPHQTFQVYHHNVEDEGE